MGVRKFQVYHGDSTFEVDCKIEDGFKGFQLQLHSLTSLVPDEQTIFVEDYGWPVSQDRDLISAPDKLRVVARGKFIISDEQFARTLQKFFLTRSAGEEYRGSFDEELQPYIRQVLMYEDKEKQKKARETVPVARLEHESVAVLIRAGGCRPSQIELEHVFLLQLLFWFKQSFRDICSKITPVQLDSGQLKLLKTKEWRYANYFMLYCRAFGYESRLVLGLTGDCWTECFSQHLGRWMHLHPFEALYDLPWLCEKCRNKKFGNVIAIAKDGVYDVTKCYTKKWGEVLDEKDITGKSAPLITLVTFTRELQLSLGHHVLITHGKALLRDFHSPDNDQIFLPGSPSWEKELCISRAEFGPYSFASSSPVRRCIDEHGTRIYNEFCSVLSQFVENSIPESKVIKVFNILRGLLVDLKFQHCKTRSSSFTLDPSEGQYMGNEFLPSLGELLDAVSLKRRLNICLAGDPLITALELPAALHAWDVLMDNFNKCQNLDEDSQSFPLFKLHKLCSGYVLASGEEFPSGIATAAFNGVRSCKWGEPNGGKGCWIMYKTRDNRMHELAAYNFMSADDPAKDPKDWVVEGSKDGGSSWHILDQQINQLFKWRYEQKLYMIKSTAFPSNLFRFQFLAVRDVHSTGLQVGKIDLYAKNS